MRVDICMGQNDAIECQCLQGNCPRVFNCVCKFHRGSSTKCLKYFEDCCVQRRFSKLYSGDNKRIQ